MIKVTYQNDEGNGFIATFDPKEDEVDGLKKIKFSIGTIVAPGFEKEAVKTDPYGIGDAIMHTIKGLLTQVTQEEEDNGKDS